MKISLTDAEWKLMVLLWESSPKTITQLTKQSRGWTKHTVITLLKRLEEKKAVRFEEGERAKRFFPVIAREDAELSKSEEFLEKIFSGRLGLMLNTMLSQKALSEDEIKELYEILERRGAQ